MAAEDHWEGVLFEALFGGVRLDIMDIGDEEPRALDITEAAHLDGSLSDDDMGGKPRVTRCRLRFFDTRFDALGSYLERFRALRALKDSGEAQTFVHPLDGQFQARIGEWASRAAAEPRDTIDVDCTFHEVRGSAKVSDTGAGAPFPAGVEDVQLAAVDFSAALASDSTLAPSTLGDDAVSTAQTWDKKTSRDINLEIVALANRIDSAVNTYEATTDIKRHGLYRALLGLHSALTKAAVVAQQRNPRLIEITTSAAVPLRVLLARTYGADQVAAREPEIRQLNVIPNPGRVPAGTTLRGQAPSATRAAGVRSTR